MAIATISRRSVEIDIEVEKGSTLNPILTWRQQAQPKTPIDLTGCTGKLQVRDEKRVSKVLYEMTTENGLITLGGTQGTVELLFDASDTTNWTFYKAIYDLEITFPNTHVRRLCRGKITVFDEVTK